MIQSPTHPTAQVIWAVFFYTKKYLYHQTYCTHGSYCVTITFRGDYKCPVQSDIILIHVLKRQFESAFGSGGAYPSPLWFGLFGTLRKPHQALCISGHRFSLPLSEYLLDGSLDTNSECFHSSLATTYLLKSQRSEKSDHVTLFLTDVKNKVTFLYNQKTKTKNFLLPLLPPVAIDFFFIIC